MGYSLDIPKLVQAAAVLLKSTSGHRMSYMRVLKLLYMAERESLAERGGFIFGDHAVAMEHGPVLSETYALVKGEHSHGEEWERSIRTDGFELVLDESPALNLLSRWETEKLHEVNARYSHLPDWDLVKKLHDDLEEWNRKPVKSGQRPIPLEHILSAVGRKETEAEIVNDREARAEFFGRLAELSE